MNWEAIGAVGEVAGAIAVVATLIYLAAQMRQNSTQMRELVSRELGEGLVRFRLLGVRRRTNRRGAR